MRDHVLDMRAIAAALTSAGIPAEVQPSGGNVATIYAGPPGHRIAIGPGWYSQDRPFCRASELSMAPEDGSADPAESLRGDAHHRLREAEGRPNQTLPRDVDGRTPAEVYHYWDGVVDAYSHMQRELDVRDGRS